MSGRRDPRQALRALLEGKGLAAAAAALDRPAPTVGELVTRGDDPFSFVGEDAATLGQAFRLSQVSSDRDVEGLRRRGFEVLADHRPGRTGGQSTGADVNQRGGDRLGVVMGRPLETEAVYAADRARRHHERRAGKTVSTEAIGRAGSGSVRTETQWTPVSGGGEGE